LAQLTHIKHSIQVNGYVYLKKIKNMEEKDKVVESGMAIVFFVGLVIITFILISAVV
jgi:hypothetical protein